MAGRMNLASRLEALEVSANSVAKPHCWLTAEDGETTDAAIARQKSDDGCIENSGGNIVWLTV